MDRILRIILGAAYLILGIVLFLFTHAPIANFIGVVCIVVGGTLMSGGRCNAIGTLIGSLFLYLIIAAMQLMGANAGIQSVVKGGLIIVVLLLGATDAAVKRPKKEKTAPSPAVTS